MTYKNRNNNNNKPKSRKQIKNYRNTKKSKMKLSHRRTLKYKHGGEGDDFKVSTNLDKITGDDTTSGIDTLKQGSQKIETKTGEFALATGKGVFGLAKTFGYNLPKAVLNLGTDWFTAQVQVYWRFFKNNKIVVFGLFGFREAQLPQMVGNNNYKLLEGGLQSRISDNLKNFDEYRPPHKEWVYPNFHDKISGQPNVYVTPIGIGSVFAIKRSKIINFAKSFLPGKTNKPDEIVDIYSPTGYYIVVRITKSAEFPAEIHYREIRYSSPEYFIGKKRYIISRVKNTVRLWNQIRVYELNLDKLNDTTTIYQESRLIVKKNSGGGGDDDDLPDGWLKIWSEKDKRFYYKNKKTREKSWNKPKLPSDRDTNEENGQSGDEMPPIPCNDEDWEEKFSSSKKKSYWVNKKCGKTSSTKMPIAKAVKFNSDLPENTRTGSAYPSSNSSNGSRTRRTAIQNTKNPPASNPPSASKPPTSTSTRQRRVEKIFDWQFEWDKVDTDGNEVQRDSEDFKKYKNKYTREVVEKPSTKESSLTNNMCNILCYMTSTADDVAHRDVYCFNNSVIPIANMKNLHKLIIYFRHISNVGNWIQHTDGKYYYIYDKNMRESLTPCHFLPPANTDGTDNYFGIEEDEIKQYFHKDELFGEDGLTLDGPVIMNKFSMTDEGFNDYKIRERERLLALQSYSK